MMTLEELIPAWRKWGNQVGFMYRIRKSVLKNINLPEETKLFLNQAGLTDNLYGYTKLPTLPRLTNHVSDTRLLSASYGRYRVLGEKGFMQFHCLDEEGEGRVVLVKVALEEEIKVTFINSSILQYAECFLSWSSIFEEIVQSDPRFPSPEGNAYIEKYAQAIREIDPDALAEEQNWRFRQVEQFKTGLLL